MVGVKTDRALASWLVLFALTGLIACVPKSRLQVHVDTELVLRKQLAERDQRIRELEDEVAGLAGECAEDRSRAQREAAECEQRIAALEKELEELRLVLGTAHREVAEGEEQIAELEWERSEQDRKVASARGRLGTLEAALRNLRVEPADVIDRREEPVEIELFFGTNRKSAARKNTDQEAPGVAGARHGRVQPGLGRLVLPLLLLALFFLLPALFKRILKPQYERWFVLGARLICGALLALLCFSMVRQLLVEEESTFGNEQIVDTERRYDLGTCTVTIPPVHRRANVEDLSIFEFRRDPSKHFTLQNVTEIDDSTVFFNELRKVVKGGDLFIFVHGYHNTFTDAAFRTAQIHYDMGFDGAPMFFSWPSEAGSYSTSEANVDGAWRALAQFLGEVLDESEAENVRLLAHSMGSRVLTKAVEKLMDERPRLFESPRFDELVLAAPDIKLANYRDVAREILPAVRNMTVYASSKDTALLASQLIHGGEPRAGQAPPEVVVGGVDTIDVSEISSGHSYVADSGRVLDHLRLILTGLRSDIRLDERTARRERTADGGEYWVLLPPSSVPSGG